MSLSLQQEKMLWESSEEYYQEIIKQKNRAQILMLINHKVIHCGDVIEFYEYEHPTVIGFERKKKPVASNSQPVINTPETLLKKKVSKAMRIYHSFIRLAYVNFNNSESIFVTLISQCSDLSECNKYFDAFMKRMRRRFGKNFKYVAVPSFDSIGSINYHVFLDIAVERKELLAIWSHGTIDMKVIKGSKSIDKLIYKYMRETLLDEKADKRLVGKKTYFKSRNLLKPVELHNQDALNIWKQFKENAHEQYPEKTYESVHNGKVKYQKVIIKSEPESQATACGSDRIIAVEWIKTTR